MLDLYGLGRGFPGNPQPAHLSGAEKAQAIEEAVFQDILATVPNCRPDRRFIPYVQVHEFEALLFSDPDAFARGLGQQNLAGQLHAIRNAFATPEDINDNPNTAPSKRVANVCGSYRKVIDGTLAAHQIGLDVMRRQCRHFDEWVNRLEAAAPLP